MRAGNSDAAVIVKRAQADAAADTALLFARVHVER
jgi:hypothetical protein